MNYSKWDRWGDQYDDEGDAVDLNLKIPLKDVNPDYFDKIDLSQVTAECGRPMTQEEFDAFRSKNKTEIINSKSKNNK